LREREIGRKRIKETARVQQKEIARKTERENQSAREKETESGRAHARARSCAEKMFIRARERDKGKKIFRERE